MLKTVAQLFTTPIASPQQWYIVLLVAIAFIFAPQFNYNDWERNTEGLFRGLHVYDNPNAVYPPWSIVLLWPYYFLTAAGSRIASVLAVGWLTARCRWSLVQFLAIVLSPFFIWTMLLSNMDLLVLLLPVVMWEAVRGTRWQMIGQGISLALLLIKPQGSFLLIAHWMWSNRHTWKQLLMPVAFVTLLVISTSVIGHPPLLIQWIDNLQHPSTDNQAFWQSNNISITKSLGLLPAVAVLSSAGVGLLVLMRSQDKSWTKNHTYASLLLAAMLLSPYTSNQSVIAALSFVPSVPGVIIQYVIVFAGAALGLYLQHGGWWALFLGMCMLWLYRLPKDVSGGAPSSASLHVKK